MALMSGDGGDGTGAVEGEPEGADDGTECAGVSGANVLTVIETRSGALPAPAVELFERVRTSGAGNAGGLEGVAVAVVVALVLVLILIREGALREVEVGDGGAERRC